MQCEICGFDNPKGMHFCGRCAAILNRVCPYCHFVSPVHSQNCSQCGYIFNDPSCRLPGKIPKHDNAERRQLTILFCDIVNSSALATKIDPEDLRDIMREYRAICSKVVNRFDGHIAQHLGDGVLVYFGYPRAHEDDARRAVNTGLEIIHRIKQFSYTVEHAECNQIAVRIGIHTGLVVVGEISENDKRVLALGETPNIAARIQNVAKENSLVVSTTTKQLLGQEFDYHSLGYPQLKGISQSLELFHVHSFCPLSERTSNPLLINSEPMVGRDKESQLLLRKLELVENGSGQVVFLSGEPGLGKTRMVQFICEKARSMDFTILDCAGMPYYQNSFFHPIMRLVNHMMGLSNINKDSDKISRIEQVIIEFEIDPYLATPILTELLKLTLNKQYSATKESTPQQKKQLAIDIFLDILATLARRHFILLVVEDLQWIDASTIELLTQFLNQPENNNIFSLFTFRDDHTPPYPDNNNFTLLTLKHLSNNESELLIKQLIHNKPLPKQISDIIINKSDGVPFFIEELTINLLHSENLIEEDDHYALSLPLTKLDIPATLKESLSSRLDDLGDFKLFAQLCSILGREFHPKILRIISEYDEYLISISLDKLISEKILYRQDTADSTQYCFRHALMHEAAYRSLLRRTRQKYHHKIARTLKDHFPSIITNNPELIAYHHTMAEEYKESLPYWLQAGRHATQRFANIEAISHYRKGIVALSKLPSTPQHRMYELKFQTELGLSIMLKKGYGSKDAKQAYDRAWKLCDGIEEKNVIFPILTGLWEYYIARAELFTALHLARRIQRLAINHKSNKRLIEAERMLGTSYFWMGEHMKALHYFNLHANSPLVTSTKTESLSPHYQDANIAALANKSCILWLIGKPQEAKSAAEAAQRHAVQLAHPFSQTYALQFLMTFHQLNGDYESVAVVADTQINLSEKYGFPFWLATGKMMRAWANSQTQPSILYLNHFKQALVDYEASGNKLARSYFYSLYTQMLHKLGKTSNAKKVIDNAINEVELSGEKYFIAEMLRIKGELFINHPENSKFSESENNLFKAMEISRNQGTKSLSLRIATSLSKLKKIKDTE